jgi:hypothetical protein
MKLATRKTARLRRTTSTHGGNGESGTSKGLSTQDEPRPAQRVQVIDSHTGGEPTRIVIAGGPELNGLTTAGQTGVVPHPARHLPIRHGQRTARLGCARGRALG